MARFFGLTYNRIVVYSRVSDVCNWEADLAVVCLRSLFYTNGSLGKGKIGE
jgi:hypothetical protein